MKTTEPQRKALKALKFGLKCTYISAGRFTHAYWGTSSREQCTATVKALLKKELVKLEHQPGTPANQFKVALTDAGLSSI